MWVLYQIILHVVGVVSGGRSVIGDCGGINNPTHYVRLALTNFFFPFATLELPYTMSFFVSGKMISFSSFPTALF